MGGGEGGAGEGEGAAGSRDHRGGREGETYGLERLCECVCLYKIFL